MMTCVTLKQGKPCIFMKKTGCSYSGGQCHVIVDACQGCDHVEVYTAGSFCNIFAEPESKWIGGICNMATHARKAEEQEAVAKKVNPLKASKRSRR